MWEGWWGGWEFWLKLIERLWALLTVVGNAVFYVLSVGLPGYFYYRNAGSHARCYAVCALHLPW